MTIPADQPRSTKLAWICALLTSALGAAILFDAFPGINWTIWVVAASVSLILARFEAVRRVETPLLILLSWAVLLSIAFALTANDAHQVQTVLADAVLLGMAVITLGAERWSELSARLLLAVPFLAPFRVATASALEVAGAPRTVSSSRSRAILKGSLLAVPLVIVLIALLGSADPVIRWGTDRIAAWFPDWSFPGRLVFFLFLLTLTLGADTLGLRQMIARLPQFPTLATRPTIGLTEQRMVLWSALVVLWLFVVLQVSYLIHPPPSAIGTGITFAEFARRGFGELSIAATLVSAIIIILEYARPEQATERERTILRRLEIALIVALELVLVSAFRRVLLYEEAYGFTESRLVAQTYMIAMGLALAALAWEISRGKISVSFGRRVAEIALASFTVLVFWNYEAWIVNKNFDRAAETGKFDTWYAGSLSRDATPTIARRRSELPQAQRDSLARVFACERLPAPRRWYEWNRSVSAAAAALRSWERPRIECAKRYD